MKKAVVAVIAFLLIVLLAGAIVAAMEANKEADETIARIDGKIWRYENGK